MWLSQWGWRISQSQDLQIYTLKKNEIKFSSQAGQRSREPMKWRISLFYVWGTAYRAFSPVKHVILINPGIVSVRGFIKIGSQDCLLDQITYKRWLRNLCGELCEMESMQSKKRKRKQRVGLYQKSHWFAAHTCSISDTTNSCVKYLTDRLSMQYSLSIELS